MPATVTRKKHEYDPVVDEPSIRPRSMPRSAAQRTRGHGDARSASFRYSGSAVPNAVVLERGQRTRESPNENINKAHPARHARATRRRVRRAHRPLRISLTVGLMSFVLLAQLIALLWLKGLTLEARDRSADLDKKIAHIEGHITRTQTRISALSSSAQLKRWAAELGLHPVTVAEIDDVTKRTPWPGQSLPGAATGSAASITKPRRGA